jgi:hypothetical protein
LSGAACALVVAVGAGEASAASVAFHPIAPVAEVPTTFLTDAQSDVTSWLHVKFRPAGGAACAPSPETDPGDYLIQNVRGSGARQESRVYTFSAPVTYLLCAWLRDSQSNVLSTQTGQLTVRAPVGSLAAAVPPLAPLNRAFVMTFAGQTEVARWLYVSYRAAGGAPCAPTPASDPGSSIVYGDRVEGAYSIAKELTLDRRGTFLVCGWLVSSSGDLAPLARLETTVTNVPPVVVSARAKLGTISTAGRRLRTGVRIPTAGRLVVRLVGKGRRIGLASVRVTGPRTVRIGYRRPARVAKGRYVLEVSFLSSGATVPTVVRRRVLLR